MTQNTTTYNVVVTQVFDAPVERVWQAWSDSALLKRWWGPTGFTAPVADMDFREGGVSLVCMRAPAEYGGQEIYNLWMYRKIVPLVQIEFVNNFCDKDGNKVEPAALGLPAEIPYDVRHVLNFKRLSDNQTELIVTEYGYPSQQIVEMSALGMKQCLEKMAAVL